MLYMFFSRDALFFFVLLIDVSKASLLARLALAAGSQREVRESIAHGVQLLGPPLTLDTLVEALLVGVGVLSGVPRLVALSWYACMSVVVNYVVFMTLYPACLSLVSEVSYSITMGAGPPVVICPAHIMINLNNGTIESNIFFLIEKNDHLR